MENNYFKNRKMLRRCERIYKFIFLAYFISCVPPALISLIYGTLYSASVDDNSTIFFAATMILLLVIFATGYFSVYKKELKFTYMSLLFAITLSLVNIIGVIHILIGVISAILLKFTNKSYQYLEQQDGFPYFNERFEENKNNLNEYINNNPYQQTMERYKNASSGKMDDI